MAVLLIIVSLGIALVSWLGVTPATLGVAGLSTACFVGILARIAQAQAHHQQLLHATREKVVADNVTAAASLTA
jgi:hypothetical protein